MPCITLISDFGLHDASMAVAKGVLLQHVPANWPIIDISHEATPYYLPQAAYLLGCAWSGFPKGTVHLVLFDIFYGPSPRLLLSAHEGHWFLAPDNGIVPAALGTVPEQSWLVFELGKNHTFIDWLHAAARAIPEIAQSESPITHHQFPIATPGASGEPNHPSPITTANRQLPTDEAPLEAIHTDHYGNVVLGITRAQFDALRGGRRFRVQFMQAEEITEVSSHYHDVREGYKLLRFNSRGYLEICINRGHAARLFGLRPGSRHNDIKIIFE